MSDRIRVDVFDQDGKTYLGTLGRRLTPGWTDELSGNGSGQVTVPADAAKLLDYRRVVKFRWNGAYRKAFRIASLDRTLIAQDGQTHEGVTATGPGLRASLADALVYPYGGLGVSSPQERTFSWSAAQGFDDSSWSAPLQASQSSYKKGFPKEWPDAQAAWIWSTDPTQPVSADTVVYFRASVSVAADTPARMSVTADDDFAVFVDGVKVIESDGALYAWQHTYEATLTLPAGTHVIGIRGHNAVRPWSSTNDAGVLFSLASTDENGDTKSVLLRSNSTSWVCHQDDGSPVGWTGASILRTLVDEAKTRGVTALTGVTYGFSDTADDSGTSWPDTQERQFRVMQDNLLTVADALAEGSFDYELDPELVLHAWITRGTDRSATVDLRAGRNVTSTKTRGQADIVNVGALLTEEGWVAFDDSSSRASWGRVEGASPTGQAATIAQGKALTDVVIAKRAQPQEQISVSWEPGTGSTPYVDFGVGDVVTAPTASGQAALRVATITVTESEDGSVEWSVDLGQRLLAPTERLLRWLRQAAGGFLGGELSSSSPASVASSSARATARGSSPKQPTTAVDDQTIPAVPGNVAIYSTLSSTQVGKATVTVTWDAVTTNADGSAITDLRDYLVRWRESGATDWHELSISIGSSASFTVDEGTSVDVEVAARDIRGNASDFSAVVSGAAVADTTPPPAPSAPTATSRVGMLEVGWDGKSSTGSSLYSDARDLARIDVHVSTTSGAAADSTTLAATMHGKTGDAVIVGGQPYGTPLYVKLVAVDLAGNASPAGAETQVTLSQVANVDLGPDAVDTAQIRDAAIGTAQIADLAVNDAKVADLSVGKLTTGELQSSTRIIAGTANGQRAEMNVNGFEVWTGAADTDRAAISLSASGADYITLTDSNGQSTASIGADGSISATSADVSSELFVGGYPVVGDSFPDHQGYRGGYASSLLDSVGGGIIGLDWIGSNYSVASEQAISQLQVRIRPNRTYAIRALAHTSLPSGSTASGLFAMAIRTTGVGGGTVSTSSSRMNLHVGYLPAFGANYGPTVIYEDVFRSGAGDDGYQTFLLTAQCLAGSIGGTSNQVQFGGASGRLGHFVIIDLGPYVQETGTGSASSTTGSSTSKQTYTKTYSATWSQTYKQDETQNTYQPGSVLLQGYYSSTNGDQASMIGFPFSQIQSDLSGATIESCKVYLYATAWYYSGTKGTARIGTHNSNASGAPSTFTGSQNRIASPSFPNPGGRWVDLGQTIGTEFRSGASTGIVLGHTPTLDQTDYGHFAGAGSSHVPKLQITYTK